MERAEWADATARNSQPTTQATKLDVLYDFRVPLAVPRALVSCCESRVGHFYDFDQMGVSNEGLKASTHDLSASLFEAVEEVRGISQGFSRISFPSKSPHSESILSNSWTSRALLIFDFDSNKLGI
jgi:hypothetical protein